MSSQLSSLQNLQSAALTVKLEESADNLDAFIDAAEDVAQKHGLDSPSKHKSTASSVEQWLEGVQQCSGPAHQAATEKENVSQAQAEAAADILVAAAGGPDQVDEAVSALAAQMGVELQEPAPGPGPATEDAAAEELAVERLLAPHSDQDFNENVSSIKSKKGVKFGGAQSVGDPAQNRDHIRYLSMRKSLDSKQGGGPSGPGGSNVVVITRRSKVSKLLDRADARASSSSGAPTGGLKGLHSQSQELMFREMKVVEDKGAQKKKKHRKIIIKGSEAERATELSNRLSTQSLKAHQGPSQYELLTQAGRKKNISQRESTYSRFEDAKECTFRPRVRKTAFNETAADDDERAQRKDNFVERQEAAERGRVSKIEMDIGKAAYDALQDKKFCPQCTAKQSYDDIKEKRKRCNNCNVEYTTTIEWNKVKKDFYERQQGMLDSIDKNRRKLADELEREKRKSTKMVFDKRKGKMVVQEVEYNPDREAKWDADMELDFFERSSKMEQKRQMHLKHIEDEMYGDVGSKSTGPSDFGGSDLYDSGSRVGESQLFGLDAATAFLHRYEEDVKRRNAIKAAQREEERARKGLMERTVEDNLCEHVSAFRI